MTDGWRTMTGLKSFLNGNEMHALPAQSSLFLTADPAFDHTKVIDHRVC
jgi:hypothetical protein